MAPADTTSTQSPKDWKHITMCWAIWRRQTERLTKYYPAEFACGGPGTPLNKQRFQASTSLYEFGNGGVFLLMSSMKSRCSFRNFSSNSSARLHRRSLSNRGLDMDTKLCNRNGYTASRIHQRHSSADQPAFGSQTCSEYPPESWSV